MEAATRISLVYIRCIVNIIPKLHKKIQKIVPVDHDGCTLTWQFTELMLLI